MNTQPKCWASRHIDWVCKTPANKASRTNTRIIMQWTCGIPARFTSIFLASACALHADRSSFSCSQAESTGGPLRPLDTSPKYDKLKSFWIKSNSRSYLGEEKSALDWNLDFIVDSTFTCLHLWASNGGRLGWGLGHHLAIDFIIKGPGN
jgi:hypothetical protein